MEQKQEIRKQMQRVLPWDKKRADRHICRRLIQSRRYWEAETVFSYVGALEEPDTRLLLEQVLADHKILLVPKCLDDSTMIAVRVTDLERLQPGTWGIPEPEEEAAWEGEIDLAVIPCVAATADGKRIGHGAGYYDRFLSSHDTCKTCLCYDERVLERIPTDDNDCLMDFVITQSERYRIIKKEEI